MLRQARCLLVLAAVLGSVPGCALKSAVPVAPEYDPRLITGVDIFGTEVTVDESPEFDMLATTRGMRLFVQDVVAGKLQIGRYRRLVNKLRDHGYFDDTYDAGITTTAARTFEEKVGNCISYTNMFVALARAAELSAHFQLVERRYPTWTVDGGMLVRNNHVNVFVEGPRLDGPERGHTVDFNLVDPDADATTRLISDAYARSLFYANLAVDQLVEGNNRVAFSYLRRAIESAPENPDLWINLGAFYSRFGNHERALEAYGVAAEIDPKEKSVLSGQEKSHRALGHIEVADKLERKVRRYRNSNPYYHFALAQAAYEDGDFDASLASVEQAIKLRKRNARFHFLKGLTLYRLGDEDGARDNFEKARRFGRYDDLWLRYIGDAPEPDLTG